jgi:hypothetical protein
LLAIAKLPCLLLSPWQNEQNSTAIGPRSFNTEEEEEEEEASDAEK